MLPVEATFSAASRMSCGARNWPFLMLTIRPGAAGRDQQVGLAAEEGGDLEDVGHFGGRAGLRGLVDVGEDGVARRLEAGQDAQAFLQARPAVGARRWCGWPCRRRP